MGQAKLYGQNKGGMSINGIIKDYYAYAGENISAGDLVEYVNGIAGKTDYGTSVATEITNVKYSGYNIYSEKNAVQLDNNRVFIAYNYDTKYHLYGAICTVQGADIIVSKRTLLSSEQSAGLHVSVELISDDKVFIAHSYSSSNHIYGMIVNIDDLEIEVVSDTPIDNDNSGGWGGSVSTELLPNNNIFLAYSQDYLYGVVLTISNDSISVGTAVKLSTSSASKPVSTALLNNGNVFIAHAYGGPYYLYGVVASINGTTITVGTDTQLSTVSYSCANNPSVVVLDNNRVFISHTHTQSKQYLYGMVCTVSGTAITKGTDTALDTSAYYTGNYASTVLIRDNIVFIAYPSGESGYMYLTGLICKIEGSNITKGASTVLISSVRTGYSKSVLLLKNGTLLMPHSYGGSDVYSLNAQIFGIDYENNVPTNQISITDYETQVRKVTTGQFDGIAKTSGEGGDDTGHNDKVSIWTLFGLLTSSRKLVTDKNGKLIVPKGGN